MADGSAECSADVCRVLVVEDNPDVARMLELALEMHGHETETTRNGTEAISVAARHLPHIAIIDIGLPGVDGLYVARELRQLVPESLLIAVTGRNDTELIDRCLASGFNHHFTKPVELDTILGMLDDWKARRGCAA